MFLSIFGYIPLCFSAYRIDHSSALWGYFARGPGQQGALPLQPMQAKTGPGQTENYSIPTSLKLRGQGVDTMQCSAGGSLECYLEERSSLL